LSFFEEDDEPRTRVRPRSATPAGGGAAPPDRRTALIRQGVLLAAGLLILLVLVLLINGCRKSARESSLKDYNREVASLVAASDTEVGKPFFDLMREPTQGAGDLRTQVNGYKNAAAQQYERAKGIDTPGEMDGAQRSFLTTMEMRRDGLQQIADRVGTALSSNAEAADKAIKEIAGANELFLTSDVIYNSRVIPLIDKALRDADVGRQQLQRTEFLPGIQWLEPATVADVLGQQLSADGGGTTREPAPGLHGTGIDSVSVGDQTLAADSPNRIPYGPDTEFTVSFTNQGENDETNVKVVLRIEGGSKPIEVTKTVPSVAAGAKATATLALDQAPPLDTPVTVVAEVRAVPGEKKKDNNKAEYDAAFLKQ
jgi:hypothetical protein